MKPTKSQNKGRRKENLGGSPLADGVRPTQPTDDAIRERAYRIHESHLGEPRSAIVDWMQAERELDMNAS